MFTPLPAPDHVAAFHLSGVIDQGDIAQAIELLELKRKEHPILSIYADFTGFEDMTAEAMRDDFKFGLTFMNDLSHYYRFAVITDKQWLSTLIKAENFITPGVEICPFSEHARDGALSWCAEAPPSRDLNAPGIKIIHTDNPRVIAFEIKGHIKQEDMHLMMKPLQEAYDKYDKVRLLARMTHYDGFDWNTALNQETWRMKMEGMKHVNRYAIVGAPSWVKGMVEMFNPIFKTDVHSFSEAEEDKAWEWVGAHEAKR